MKDLYIHEDVISKTSDHRPKPSSRLVWLKTQGTGKDYSKTWLGLKVNAIEDYSSTDILFKPKAARISTTQKKHYIRVDIDSSYQVEQLDDQVQIWVPEGNLVIPKCSDIFDDLLNIPKVKKCDRPRRVNNTVYVDQVYGDDLTGELENPKRPFKTIQTGINAIPDLPLPNVFGCLDEAGWIVRVAPGVYVESLVIPHLIRVLGSGKDQTIVQGVSPIVGEPNFPAVTMTSVGFNSIEELSICGAPTPLILVDLSNPTEDSIGVTTFNEVEINATPLPIEGQDELDIIRIMENGINGVANFLNSRIRVNAVSIFAARINVFSSDQVVTQVTNSKIELVGQPGSSHSIVNASSQFVLEGGSTNFQIIDAVPTVPNLLYQVENGLLNVNNHSVVAINTALGGGDGIPITFFTTNLATINVNNVNINSGGFPQELQQLSCTSFETDVINLLSVQFPFTFVPSIKGPGQVNHFVNSQGGNMIGRGGPYSNIRAVDQDEFLQDNDYTLIVSTAGITISLPDPSQVNNEVLYTGKQARVVNNSDGDITIVGAQGGDIILPSNNTIDLQANDVAWFSIGTYLN